MAARATLRGTTMPDMKAIVCCLWCFGGVNRTYQYGLDGAEST